MAESSLIPDEAKAFIGKETITHIGEVSAMTIKRYASTVGDLNPLYLDEEYARKSKYGSLVAPPNYLGAVVNWGVAPEQELMPDGLPVRPERAALKVKRGMGGGQELRFLKPVRAGDSFTVKRKVVDMYEKQGKQGPVVFVIADITFTNQHGEDALIIRDTAIVH